MSSHARHSPTRQNILFCTFATDRRLAVVAASNGGYASSHGCRVNCVCDQQTAEGAASALPGRAAPGSAADR